MADLPLAHQNILDAHSNDVLTAQRSHCTRLKGTHR